MGGCVSVCVKDMFERERECVCVYKRCGWVDVFVYERHV